MGTAKFWFYPQPDGRRLVEIDLGESLGELFSDWDVDTVDGRSLDGGQFRSVGRGNETVSIQRDRMLLGEEAAAQLYSLQNHLDRGYNVAFSADHTKSSAIPLVNNPTSGQTQIRLGADTFSNMWGIQTPSPGDRFVLMTSGPGVITEMIKVDSVNLSTTSGGTLDTVDQIVFSYDKPVFLRWWRSWPLLKRPQADVGKNIVTNEGGRLWSLDLRLQTNNPGMFGFHPGETLQEFGLINNENSGLDAIPMDLFSLDSFDGSAQGVHDLSGFEIPENQRGLSSTPPWRR